MTSFICRQYWDNLFLHYFLPGIIGPLAAIVLLFVLRKRLSQNFWLVSLVIYFLINYSSCYVGVAANNGCQMQLFGEVGDDPGDVGIVFFTLPIFLISFLIGFIAIFFIKRVKKRDVLVTDVNQKKVL